MTKHKSFRKLMYRITPSNSKVIAERFHANLRNVEIESVDTFYNEDGSIERVDIFYYQK